MTRYSIPACASVNISSHHIHTLALSFWPLGLFTCSFPFTCLRVQSLRLLKHTQTTDVQLCGLDVFLSWCVSCFLAHVVCIELLFCGNPGRDCTPAICLCLSECSGTLRETCLLAPTSKVFAHFVRFPA